MQNLHVLAKEWQRSLLLDAEVLHTQSCHHVTAGRESAHKLDTCVAPCSMAAPVPIRNVKGQQPACSTSGRLFSRWHHVDVGAPLLALDLA